MKARSEIVRSDKSVCGFSIFWFIRMPMKVPPARTVASSPKLARSANASSSDVGANHCGLFRPIAHCSPFQDHNVVTDKIVILSGSEGSHCSPFQDHNVVTGRDCNR